MVLYLDGVAGNPASLPLPEKMTLPFLATSEEFEEYRSVMDEMADEADRIPDPEPEEYDPILGLTDREMMRGDFLKDAKDDSYLDPSPEDYPDDGYAGDPYGRDDDYSEYGQEGCCGDF